METNGPMKSISEVLEEKIAFQDLNSCVVIKHDLLFRFGNSFSDMKPATIEVRRYSLGIGFQEAVVLNTFEDDDRLIMKVWTSFDYHKDFKSSQLIMASTSDCMHLVWNLETRKLVLDTFLGDFNFDHSIVFNYEHMLCLQDDRIVLFSLDWSADGSACTLKTAHHQELEKRKKLRLGDEFYIWDRCILRADINSGLELALFSFEADKTEVLWILNVASHKERDRVKTPTHLVFKESFLSFQYRDEFYILDVKEKRKEPEILLKLRFPITRVLGLGKSHLLVNWKDWRKKNPKKEFTSLISIRDLLALNDSQTEGFQFALNNFVEENMLVKPAGDEDLNISCFGGCFGNLGCIDFGFTNNEGEQIVYVFSIL